MCQAPWIRRIVGRDIFAWYFPGDFVVGGVVFVIAIFLCLLLGSAA